MFFKTDPYELEINIIYYSVTQKYKSYNLFKLLDSNNESKYFYNVML